MTRTDISTLHRRMLSLMCATVVVMGSHSVFAQSSAGMNKQEQEALKIVNAWDAAWNQKDPQKVASYMADDVLFLGTRKGLATFFEEYKKQNMQNITYEIKSEYAAGDEGQTVVVQKRIDHVVANGRQMEMSWVGYFRVKGGKIIEWQDVLIGGMLPGRGPAGGNPPPPPQ